MKLVTVVVAGVVMVGAVAWGQAAGPATRATTRPAATTRVVGAERWEREIRAFEKRDREEGMPKEGGVEFVGSSTIRKWDLSKSFPGRGDIYNRGFGGSEMSELVFYADRIVLKYRPGTVVVYEGDNDIAAGKTAEKVAGDLEKLLKKIRAGLPETKVVVLGIKPSPSRWKLKGEMHRAGELMREVCEKDPRTTYVSTEEAVLSAEGEVRPELYQRDGLHLSEKGYEIFARLVGPYVGAEGKG